MNRRKQILDKLSDHGCNTMLVTKPENVTWLTGFTGDSSHLLISEKGSVLITDGRYTEQAKMECRSDIDIMLWIDNERFGIKTYRHVNERLNTGSLGFESSVLSFANHKKLSEGLDKIRMVPVEGLIEKYRMTKDEQETAFLRKACRISDRALELTVPSIKPGVSEIAITAELEYNLKTNGADDISFTTIVLSGTKTSLLHGKPDSKKIARGEFLLFDFGALYKGYHADISRTFVIGKASGKQHEMYDIIRNAQQKAVECLKPGVEGKKPDDIVRENIPEKYIEYYYPGLGHGVGLEIHEAPLIKNISDFIYKKGMAVTIEPGIYIPGEGGLRIEDTVLITGDSYESLTHFPRKMMEIS